MTIFNNGSSSSNNYVYLDNENQGSKYEISGGNQKWKYQSYEVVQLDF